MASKVVLVVEDDLAALTWDDFEEVRLIRAGNQAGPAIYSAPRLVPTSNRGDPVRVFQPERILAVMVEDPYDDEVQRRITAALRHHGASLGWLKAR